MEEFSLNSEPVTHEELEETRKLATQSMWLWARRAALAGIVLVLTFASALRFSPKHSLHTPWSDVGGFLLLLSVGLLGGFAVSLGMIFSCWFDVRQLRKAERGEVIPDWLK